MNSRIKRPPTVWLTQTLLIIFALLWLSSILLNLAMLSRAGEGFPLIHAAIGLAIIIGFVLLLLIAFWGLARRKMYGKWLGVLSLILLWGFLLYTQIRPTTGPWKRYEFNSPAELFGAVIAQVLISALFLVLILRLAFAKRVNKFFQRDIEVT